MGEPRRWTVTFTKHVHQKRKLYQDGILELNGLKNKVLLYDESEKLLDSRYLKKDEVVSSGGTLVFNSYLVDVGDCEDKGKPLSDLGGNDQDKQSNGKNYIKRPNAPQNSSGIQSVTVHKIGCTWNHQGFIEAQSREWNALYTAQITQKSKKYHDGILQLIGHGSHTRQAILLSEDRSVLSSKYMKSVENLRSGISIELPSYLVQICEPRDPQGGDQGKSTMSNDISVSTSNIRSILVKKKCHEKKPLSNEELKKSLLIETEGTGCSQVGNIPCNMEASRDKAFRDVSQILCRLQKTGERCGPGITSVEKVRTSKFSSPLILDAMNKCETSRLITSGVKVDHKGINESVATHISTMKNIIKKAPACQHEQRSDDSSTSASLSSGSLALVSKSDKKCPANSQPIPQTLVAGAKQSEDNSSAINNQNDGSTISIKVNDVDRASFFPVRGKENFYEVPSDLTDLQESCGTTLIFSHVKDDISNQHAAVRSSGREQIDNVSPVDMPSSVQSSSSAPTTITSEPSLESSMLKTQKQPNIPSFELGI